ncbi:MAG: hypothetical protein RQ982_11815 [Gammaproteobacteria bacterium]|nr:hypothetical protein [Gammaproteobacteria bacterium]
MPLFRYIAQLSLGKMFLWVYLIWYITISTFYFDDDPKLWLTALGISLIVGFALVLSTTYWPIKIRELDHWQTFRLFLIPFLVSSYSSLIKDKGCFVIFPPDLKTNSIALSVIISFLIFVVLVKKISGNTNKDSNDE